MAKAEEDQRLKRLKEKQKAEEEVEVVSTEAYQPIVLDRDTKTKESRLEV